jgi:superoxide dismutase
MQLSPRIPFLIMAWVRAQYKNLRPEYLKNIWKVVNWKNVADRYAAASSA